MAEVKILLIWSSDILTKKQSDKKNLFAKI